MRRFYIRTASYGLSEEQQRAILAPLGLTEDAVYVDGPVKKRRKEGEAALPARDLIIRGLRKGEVVVIAEEGILGLSYDDTLGAMARIADKSARVYVAKTGKTYAYEPRDAAMMDFFRDGDHQRLKRRAQYARQELNRMGKGGRRALRGAARERAKAAWFDPKRSASEIAAEFDVSRPTLYKEFGPRNTPDATQRGRRR